MSYSFEIRGDLGFDPGLFYSVRRRPILACWHKAAMLNALTNVRFQGQSGHRVTL
jgi:hypothetical protein